MASLSDFLDGDTLANAGNILGQNMARRGGLLGLPVGALIGGASQNALQQRQQGIQNTLANQIRSYAAQSKDPAEQQQLHLAADMAMAGGDPSTLLHLAKSAAAKPNFKTLHNIKGELTGAWDPASGQFVPPPTQGAFDTVPKAPSMNTPFAANMQGYLLTHPGDEAGAAAFAQQKDLETQIAAKQAGERPEYSHMQIGDKIYTYDVHNPGSMHLMGSAPPTAANTDSFSPVTVGGGPDSPGEIVPFSHRTGKLGAPVGTAPLKKGAGDKMPTRGSTKINGYSYQTLKNPDGSMVATFSDTPGLSAMLAPYGLGKKIPKTLYFKPGSTKPIPLPEGVNPADVEATR